MTGWTLKAAKVIAMAGLLIAGVGVSAALADNGNGNGNGNDPQATTTPGSPGDDCSHGSNSVTCRPDPNQNGKDCEDHGNAKGNEDHCNQADTTTTTESTPETTTTNETTTTTPETTTNPGSPGTPSGNGGSSSSSAGGSAPSSASAPPVSTPEQEQAPAQQVKGARVSHVAAASSTPGQLPFTGFPAWVLALIGSAMLAAGLGIRRVASRVAS
jgi:hypothetical protein